MTDIVTRLRGELVVRLNGEPWVTFDALPVLGEAADEIERLRNLADELHKRGLLQVKCTDKVGEALDEAHTEIERLRADRDNWKDLASEYYHLDPKCECHLCDRFREAIASTK